MLTGIGDDAHDRAVSIAAMRDEGSQQVRVMTFVPQAGTPLAGRHVHGDEDELLTIAALRLAMPGRLIPASLDVDGIAGLDHRLQAGANVVTSLVPPAVGLAGVSNAELDIDDGQRTVAGVLPHLARLGLRAASVAEYGAWLAAARTRGGDE
jgi:methylornithine synthase